MFMSGYGSLQQAMSRLVRAENEVEFQQALMRWMGGSCRPVCA